MKWFNIDLHISVISDLKSIFSDQGHSNEDISLSGHSWVMGRSKSSEPLLSNWQGLTPKICDEFYKKYRDTLDKYDGFIVTYPPAFSLLFEKFNKPIIVYVPIRYEAPFTNNPPLLKWFNDFLIRGIDSNQIHLVANSIYDQKYCEYFLQRPCSYITSWCDYGQTYPKWTGASQEFLQFNDTKFPISIPGVVNRANLRRPYKWSDLEKFRGIIHVPYNISTMSLYEQYTANTPLFLPSIDFLIQLKEFGALNQITWNKTFNLPSVKDDSPNNFDNNNILKRWLPYAEYYNQESMPFITYFDSLSQLIKLKDSVNLNEISEKMSQHNLVKKGRIYESWANLLNNI